MPDVWRAANMDTAGLHRRENMLVATIAENAQKEEFLSKLASKNRIKQAEIKKFSCLYFSIVSKSLIVNRLIPTYTVIRLRVNQGSLFF